MIEIPGKGLHATSGALDMLTVNINGSREQAAEPQP
jgi:hypothetical protein